MTASGRRTDKRRVRRHPRRMKVVFTVAGSASDAASQGFTADLSESGCFVVSTRLPPLNARVRLQLVQDTSRSVVFEGVVARHKLIPQAMQTLERGGFGVRFLTPAEVVAEVLPPGATQSSTSVPALTGRFEVTFANAAELAAAWARELRHQGIFVRTAQDLSQGSDVAVTLQLPFAGETIELAARVMGRVGLGADGGLALTFVDPAALAAKLGPHVTGG